MVYSDTTELENKDFYLSPLSKAVGMTETFSTDLVWGE